MNKSPAVYGAFFVPVFVSSSDTLIRLCYIVLAKINILGKKSRRNIEFFPNAKQENMFIGMVHINPKPGNPIPLGAWRKGFFYKKIKISYSFTFS